MTIFSSRITCLALALLLAGCHTGPRIEHMRTPWKPDGAHLDIRLERLENDAASKVAGELLAVRADGLLVLVIDRSGSRLLLVPWSRIRNADAGDLPGVGWYRLHSETTRKQGVEELRRVSRYPQGLTPSVLAALLEITGQSAVETLPQA